MRHPWFQDIDWDLLIKKQVTPPFKPNVSDGDWEKNFDEEFTQEEPINSFVPTNQEVGEYEDEFQGFSYVSKPNGM